MRELTYLLGLDKRRVYIWSAVRTLQASLRDDEPFEAFFCAELLAKGP